MSQSIINLIRQIAPRYGADPRLMIAVARVESGLNSHAVGDGGTSFNLFQDHVGGALPGGALGARIRAGDPIASITHAASTRFRGVHTPEGAYQAQRPADHAGYVSKVAAALGGLPAGLNAPVSGGAAPGGVGAAPAGGGMDIGKQFAMSLIFRDKPIMRTMYGLMMQNQAAAPEPVAPGGSPAAGMGSLAGGVGQFGGLDSWQDIQRAGMQLFGLRNDPGNSQTTGGRHTSGSEHYAGRAVDFGNARNSQSQLNSWAAWARAHGLDVLNEGDHMHVSVGGGGI